MLNILKSLEAFLPSPYCSCFIFGLVPTGLALDAFVAGFIGLGLSAAEYIAEVFRAGIAAVHKGLAMTSFLMSWPLSILTRRIELRLKHGKKSLTP